MMRYLTLLLLSGALALGQNVTNFTLGNRITLGDKQSQIYGAAGGASYSPTNVAGFNVAAWYRASDYITNGGTVELPDRTGKSQKMTQASIAKAPIYNATGLNGLPTINFLSAQGMKVVTGATNNPYEVVLVLKWNDAGIADFQYIFSDGTATRPMFGFNSLVRDKLFDLDYSITDSGFASTTNKWLVLNLVWLGTNSVTAYTNMNQFVRATAVTSRVLTGWSIGERAAAGRYSKFELAEMLIYAGSGMPHSNTTARTDLFTYLTNRYAITP
jgi:hypothetical protein